jgi:hypothetical protein
VGCSFLDLKLEKIKYAKNTFYVSDMMFPELLLLSEITGSSLLETSYLVPVTSC